MFENHTTLLIRFPFFLFKSHFWVQNSIFILGWSHPRRALASLALLAASRVASEALLAALLPKSSGAPLEFWCWTQNMGLGRPPEPQVKENDGTWWFTINWLITLNWGVANFQILSDPYGENDGWWISGRNIETKNAKLLRISDGLI